MLVIQRGRLTTTFQEEFLFKQLTNSSSLFSLETISSFTTQEEHRLFTLTLLNQSFLAALKELGVKSLDDAAEGSAVAVPAPREPVNLPRIRLEGS